MIPPKSSPQRSYLIEGPLPLLGEGANGGKHARNQFFARVETNRFVRETKTDNKVYHEIFTFDTSVKISRSKEPLSEKAGPPVRYILATNRRQC